MIERHVKVINHLQQLSTSTSLDREFVACSYSIADTYPWIVPHECVGGQGLEPWTRGLSVCRF